MLKTFKRTNGFLIKKNHVCKICSVKKRASLIVNFFNELLQTFVYWTPFDIIDAEAICSSLFHIWVADWSLAESIVFMGSTHKQ